MVRTLPTGDALRDLVLRSRWYRVAVIAALLGAALDGWLSPVVIHNHPGTGELNPVSAFHVLDAVAFGAVRVFAVVVATVLVALAVRRQGTSVWSHGAMALIAAVNYVNGTVALSSGMAAIVGAQIDVVHFTGQSLTAAAAAFGLSFAVVFCSPASITDRVEEGLRAWSNALAALQYRR